MTKIEKIADGRKIKEWKGIHNPLWIRWDNIYQAYKNPGIAKVKSWERIEQNAIILDATVGISNKNTNLFVCVGNMLDDNNKSVEFKLTKDYCYIRYRF